MSLLVSLNIKNLFFLHLIIKKNKIQLTLGHCLEWMKTLQLNNH